MLQPATPEITGRASDAVAGKIRSQRRTYLVQARRFLELLDEAINRYANRACRPPRSSLPSSSWPRSCASRCRAPVSDAVCQNDAAVLELGDDTLKAIAQAPVKAVRESATIDWNLKESVQAGLRAKVKRLLARYDYPPDKEERAIELVLEQAQLFADTEAA